MRWDLRESGPAEAERTVLLLPGGMCTGVWYDDIVSEARRANAPIRFVAATLPGFGPTEPPPELTMETYARLAGKLASDLGCDVVVGHSFGANVAIEMAALGEFTGPMVLLSPSFCREDEFTPLAILDRVGRVPGVGHLAWMAAMKLMPKSMEDGLPPARREALVADMKSNDPGFCRRVVRHYFRYLDQHGSLAPRLCLSGVRAWVVFGDRDEIGLTGDEQSVLDACPTTKLVTVKDATHMLIVEQPARLAELIGEVAATPG
jgi:pimeloyl-ACP methyl ester carboxylesterase